jgi:hypothetical protein
MILFGNLGVMIENAHRSVASVSATRDQDVHRRLREVARTLASTSEKGMAIDFKMLASDIEHVLAELTA